MADTFAGIKDKGLIKTQAIIGGKLVDANDGKTVKVMNPATGKLLGTVPELGINETKDAIKVAAEAFKTWGKTTAKERHDVLMKWFHLLHVHKDDLALLISLENGKPLSESLGEIDYAASFLEWFAEEAVRTYGEHIPSSSIKNRNIVIKQPIGVVAALTPWNFPSGTVTRKLAPAVAAGCTLVLKPAPETPFSSLALVELARRAGLPDGVINVVTTQENVKEVGAEMCTSPTVKKITFTGSTAVAKLLYRQAAGTLKKVSLEAGGNAPFIVFDDADLEEAAAVAAVCKFRLSGQVCIAANRIYVQEGVYDKFADLLVKLVSSFKVGDGTKDGTTHGPLIHDRAVAKVQQHVDDAVERGASVLVGGKRVDGTGSFFAPTVLSGVVGDSRLISEETFGPVAALVKFRTEEEVVQLANSSDAGLAGYFFSRNIGRVWRVAEALESGIVGANTEELLSASMPFGGIKESGFGREGSHGIEEYMFSKLIAFGI